MRFECGDLDRALANPDLMPEAREHLKTCAVCRSEYRLWTEISSAARELHKEWESPGLWAAIRKKIEAEPKLTVAWWKEWKTWAIAAALMVALLTAWLVERQASQRTDVLETRAKTRLTTKRDFLTEQALADVEKSEAAYRKSIDTLSRLAEPVLTNDTSASAVNSREKLLMLDSAITDTRNNIAANRFNVRLQTTLAGLYREKQQTLQELLTRDQKN